MAQSTAPKVIPAVRLPDGSPRIAGTAPEVRTTFAERKVCPALRARPESAALKSENPLKDKTVIGNDQIVRADFVSLVNLLTNFTVPPSATAGTKRINTHAVRITGRTIPLRRFRARIVLVMQRIAGLAIPIVQIRTMILQSIRTVAFPTTPNIALACLIIVRMLFIAYETVPNMIATGMQGFRIRTGAFVANPGITANFRVIQSCKDFFCLMFRTVPVVRTGLFERKTHAFFFATPVAAFASIVFCICLLTDIAVPIIAVACLIKETIFIARIAVPGFDNDTVRAVFIGGIHALFRLFFFARGTITVSVFGTCLVF